MHKKHPKRQPRAYKRSQKGNARREGRETNRKNTTDQPSFTSHPHQKIKQRVWCISSIQVGIGPQITKKKKKEEKRTSFSELSSLHCQMQFCSSHAIQTKKCNGGPAQAFFCFLHANDPCQMRKEYLQTRGRRIDANEARKGPITAWPLSNESRGDPPFLQGNTYQQ